MEIIKLVDGKLLVTLDRFDRFETVLEKIAELNTSSSQNSDTVSGSSPKSTSYVQDNTEDEEIGFTLEDLPIGTTVYSTIYGKGTIEKIEKDSLYPISVKFPTSNSVETFDPDGRNVITHRYPSLFHSLDLLVDTMKSISLENLPNLEVDTVLKVFNTTSRKSYLRHFAKFDEYGNIYCYPEGTTSYTYEGKELIKWDSWKIYDPIKHKDI